MNDQDLMPHIYCVMGNRNVMFVFVLLLCYEQLQYNTKTKCAAIFILGRLTNESRYLESLNQTREILGDEDSGRYFLCNSGETISFLGVCNGYKECLDASDETDCNASSCK